MSRSNLDDNETFETTWTGAPTASLNDGLVIKVSDIADSPVYMVSNGTEYVPVNGQCTLSISGVGYGIMPSGTVATGSSGHFTSGTALPHTYSAGLWMYFAATAGITPALTAGFYWCVFSTTAICTIYTNGPSSAAYNFTVGAATVGSTAEVTARTVTIPAGLMGEMGQLETHINSSILNSGTSKTTRAKLGGSTCITHSPAAQASMSGKGVISNTTSGVQISPPTFAVTTSTTANTRTVVDTTAETTYSLTLQIGAATDYIINHSFRLDLYKV